MHELNIYWGVIWNDTEEWWKIWTEIDLSFQNWHKEFDNFWLEHWKVSKIYTLMGCFRPKYIIFELKKYRGGIFHDTREKCKIWIKSDWWFEKWHQESGKFSPEHTRVSKLGLLLGPFIQSRKCISLKFTGKLYVMTMKNDAKFEKKLTDQFKIDIKNLTNFHWSTQNFKKLLFNGLLLTKVHNVWAKKVHRSYVWWHWLLMQNWRKTD